MRCPVLRGRKSGYAPVGMTVLFGNAKYCFQDELSSRPERSVAEGSAVRPSDFPNSSLRTLFLRNLFKQARPSCSSILPAEPLLAGRVRAWRNGLPANHLW